MRRVDEAVREVLGDAVRDLQDPRIGFVTISDVATTADLRHARVHVSVLGTPDEQAASIAGLASAHGLLQDRINRELRMKRTPTLEFLLDETPQTAARMEELLAAAPPAGRRRGRGIVGVSKDRG